MRRLVRNRIHSEDALGLIKKKNLRYGKKGDQAIKLKNIEANKSMIRSKKYTGGNIIIGRAHRFKKTVRNNEPGPGEYRYPVGFQKYTFFN